MARWGEICEAQSGGNAKLAASQNEPTAFTGSSGRLALICLKNRNMLYSLYKLSTMNYRVCLAKHPTGPPVEPREADAVAEGLESRLRLKLSLTRLSRGQPSSRRGPGVSLEIETCSHCMPGRFRRRRRGPGVSLEIETCQAGSGRDPHQTSQRAWSLA